MDGRQERQPERAACRNRGVEQYRKLLEPHVPDLLNVLVAKAMDGDLAALRLVLDRVYPVRDATMAELLEEIEELRQLVETRRTAA